MTLDPSSINIEVGMTNLMTLPPWPDIPSVWPQGICRETHKTIGHLNKWKGREKHKTKKGIGEEAKKIMNREEEEIKMEMREKK